MLNNESLMTFLFRVANIIILVGTFVYLVKNYLLEIIKKGLQSHKKQVKSLQSEQSRLTEQSTQIEQDIAEQQSYGNSLIENIEKWSEAEKVRHQARIQRRVQHDKRLAAKRKIQSDYRVQEDAEQEVVIAALHDTEQQIKKHFAYRNPNAAFVAEIVEKLKSRPRKQ